MDTTEPTPFSSPDTLPPLESREQFSDEEVSAAIATQLEVWAQRAASRHPTVMHQSFANHILQQLAPGSLEALATTAADHPLDPTASDDLRRYEAEQAHRSYHTRKVLISVTRDETLDNTPIRNAYFNELFEAARHYRGNPHTPTTYSAALQALSRLYNQYELHEEATPGQHTATEPKNFAIIIEKLVGELRNHTV